jgi:hypothetical protein
MITPTTSTDPLVEAVATRLRLIDLIGWQRIATWVEQSKLPFEDLRLLLALALKTERLREGAMTHPTERTTHAIHNRIL